MNISDIKNWLKNNLFSNWYYSLITLFIFYLLLITLPPFLDWALIKATFIGNSKTGKAINIDADVLVAELEATQSIESKKIIDQLAENNVADRPKEKASIENEFLFSSLEIFLISRDILQTSFFCEG